MDEAEKIRIMSAYDTVRGAWRKRKRMAKELIDAICGDNKRPKDFMDELGIETDEQQQTTLEGTELQFKRLKKA